MRVFAVMLFAGLLVAGCQTPCPAPDTEPVTTRFICEDGSDLTVTFSRGPDQARIAEEGYATLSLPARIAGSGYTYAAGGAELRRRGANTTWMRPGAALTVCSEAPLDGAAQARASLPRQAMSMERSSMPNCPSAGLAALGSRTNISAL